MKGKYITTSLMLTGSKSGNNIIVDEIKAITSDHTLIWSRTVATAKIEMQQVTGRDQLKMV
jgi:hypothetical protein